LTFFVIFNSTFYQMFSSSSCKYQSRFSSCRTYENLAKNRSSTCFHLLARWCVIGWKVVGYVF